MLGLIQLINEKESVQTQVGTGQVSNGGNDEEERASESWFGHGTVGGTCTGDDGDVAPVKHLSVIGP
jgi:hypothetical protein